MADVAGRGHLIEEPELCMCENQGHLLWEGEKVVTE